MREERKKTDFSKIVWPFVDSQFAQDNLKVLVDTHMEMSSQQLDMSVESTEETCRDRSTEI